MKDDILNFIKYQLQEHSGRTIGVVLGFIIALCILIFGFFHTLFVLICMGIGLYLGSKIDDKEDSEFAEGFLDRLQRLLSSPFSRRRW